MIAAWIYAALCLVTALFQVALYLGAPWGGWTQGGRHPGALPPRNRTLALATALFLLALGASVLATRDGGTRIPGWIATALTAAVFLSHVVSPSRSERALWAPVTAVMLGAALWAMLG